MKRDKIELKANNSSGNQTLYLDINELDNNQMFFTLVGTYEGKKIQIDFDLMDSEEWREFKNMVNRVDRKIKKLKA